MARPRLLSAAGFLLLLLSSAARAQPFAANFVVAGLVPLSMPLDPIAKGKWDISLSPVYFKSKTFNTTSGIDDYKDVSGAGGAGSLVYGLSDHFALGLTGLGFSGTGSYVSPSPLPGAGPGPYDNKSNGGLLAASVIWDAFEGEGFRLPVLFGFHYESLHDTVDFGAAGTEKQDLSTPGMQFGISPQFNAGPLRLEPFVMNYFPFGHEKQLLNGADLGYTIHSDAGPQPGINVVLRPWNLSFFTALGAGKAKGTHVYSVRWKKSFGD